MHTCHAYSGVYFHDFSLIFIHLIINFYNNFTEVYFLNQFSELTLTISLSLGMFFNKYSYLMMLALTKDGSKTAISVLPVMHVASFPV